MNNIVVVADATVLGNFLMIGQQEQMRLILVTQIRAVRRVIEMRGTLVLIISSPIKVVELEPHTELLPCVHTEFRRQMVFAVRPVTSRIECNIGEWRQRIREMELVDGRDDKVIGLRKDELPGLWPVDNNAVNARRTKVSRRIVFAAHARREDGIHEHMWHRVRNSQTSVAEARVYGPHLDALRYLLVRSQRVLHVFVSAPADIARSVHLVVSVVELRVNMSADGHEHQKDYDFPHLRNIRNETSTNFSITATIRTTVAMSRCSVCVYTMTPPMASSMNTLFNMLRYFSVSSLPSVNLFCL